MGEGLPRGRCIFNAIKDLIRAGVTAVNDVIRMLFYFLNVGLFSLYRHLRLTFVLNACAVPITEDLDVSFGGPPFETSQLWQSVGNLPPGQYPVEQIPSEEEYILSGYRPFRPPNSETNLVEQPPAPLTAPYGPPPGQEFGSAFPDAFTDGPLGPDDMFQPGSPEPAATVDGLASFDSQPRNFGSVMANCAEAIRRAEGGSPPLFLPDYNLDGDRGWAWPTWDVDPMPTDPNPQSGNVPDPLNPRDLPGQQPEAQVNATPAPN